MATIITGDRIVNADIVAGTETRIDYTAGGTTTRRWVGKAGIKNMGSSNLYIAWGTAATVGGQNCLWLGPGEAYNVSDGFNWEYLSVVSDAAGKVQVVLL